MGISPSLPNLSFSSSCCNEATIEEKQAKINEKWIKRFKETYERISENGVSGENFGEDLVRSAASSWLRRSFKVTKHEAITEKEDTEMVK
jgi:hypothetical protein